MQTSNYFFFIFVGYDCNYFIVIRCFWLLYFSSKGSLHILFQLILAGEQIRKQTSFCLFPLSWIFLTSANHHQNSISVLCLWKIKSSDNMVYVKSVTAQNLLLYVSKSMAIAKHDDHSFWQIFKGTNIVFTQTKL